MDINELGNIILGSVKKYISTKYFAQNKLNENYYSAYDYSGEPVTIDIFLYGVTVMYKSLKSVFNYHFLKQVGEIFSYYKFESCEDGSLNIIVGRTVRRKDEKFALLVKGANVRYVTRGVTPEKIVSWPYPYYGVSFEDTLKLLERNGNVEATPTEPEFADEITADNIHYTMESLAANIANKLNVEPSR